MPARLNSLRSASIRPCTKQPHLQSGFVAVLIMMMMAMAAVAALTANLWGGANSADYDRKITRQALQKAKEAVLMYVELGDTVGYASMLTFPAGSSQGLGHLPCTDLNGDGLMSDTCGTEAVGNAADIHSLGLLPWRTLGIATPRDSAGECLWYAVAGSHKAGTRPAVINADTAGQFSIIQPVKNINPATGAVTWTERLLAGDTSAGALPVSANRVVAVIIAPGAASSVQDRTQFGANRHQCPLPLAIAGEPHAQASSTRYLESYTSISINGDNSTIAAPFNIPKIFVQADENHEKLNDELIWITAEEFANAASKRALRTMAKAIDIYVYGGYNDVGGATAYVPGNGRYPPAAAAPGGACVGGRVQGFVPHTCPGVGTGPALDMGAAAGSLATDLWETHAHYVVAPNCLLASGAAITTPPFNAANVPANICTPGARVTIGTDTNSIHAMVLLRGMPRVGQALCNTGLTMHECLENATNRATALARNAAVIPLPNNLIGTYEPIGSGSNDLMHIFRQRTR